jgi:hypothetical protein
MENFKVCRSYGGGSHHFCSEGNKMYFVCTIEGGQYENMTAQDLQHIATDIFVIADKQSMEDETFLLAHNDCVFEEDKKTGEFGWIGTVLKTGRYPAFDIWMPVMSLPISECDWEDLIPYRREW